MEKRVPVDEIQHEGSWARRPISTLDPHKLVRSDFMDLSGRLRPAVSPNALPTSEVSFGCVGKSRLRFPPNTCGFLYYRSPPDFAPLAGEIRFRLVEGEDPAGFAQGYDLVHSSGLPWHINVASLRHQSTLAAQLINEKFMTPSLFRKCRGKTLLLPHRVILHSLGQPFTVNFGQNSLYVSRGEEICIVNLNRLVVDRRHSQIKVPYRGQIHLPMTSIYTHTLQPILYLQVVPLCASSAQHYLNTLPNPHSSYVYSKYLVQWSASSPTTMAMPQSQSKGP